VPHLWPLTWNTQVNVLNRVCWPWGGATLAAGLSCSALLFGRARQPWRLSLEEALVVLRLYTPA